MSENARPRRYFNDSPFVHGGYFDIWTYTGTLRIFVFALLIIYGGRYIDFFGGWLWGLFGEELIISPGKADWYARVACGLATPLLILSPINLFTIFRRRRYLRAAAPQAAQQAALWLKERAEHDRKEGKNVDAGGAVPRQPEQKGLVQRWPILHDVVWGWPLLLALPLTLFGEPLNAMRGLVLGVFAYSLSHTISKTGLPMPVKLGMAWSIGALAVGLWFYFFKVQVELLALSTFLSTTTH
ncbi:hypothetical protein E6C76_05470 [Pseudothauera nasutitermitis]|uniref:Uncharacterized protein n=1 Tax=Pseudothauera nasutitermitis TaxID=2565930 RepID=A0A4S4B167_9RHOO|nr:hypothetical protein [Pseudothauera nasutitermitis]THF66292.1 hypothetical protein E6C76_05470 [Pseudothauera nasutitermitis]